MRRVRVCFLYDQYIGVDERIFEYLPENTKISFTQEYTVSDNKSAYQIYLELGEPEEILWWATNPPIDAEVGWQKVAHNRGRKCSMCGFRIRNKNAIENTNSYYQYCPNCGEKMGRELDNYRELNEEEWNEPVDCLSEGRDF